MQIKLTENYEENVSLIRTALRVRENFDVLEKTLTLDKGELTFFFIDGFTKDTSMQKLIKEHLLSGGKIFGHRGIFLEKDLH